MPLKRVPPLEGREVSLPLPNHTPAIEEIARRLSSLVAEVSAEPGPPATGPQAAAQVARRLQVVRRRRAEVFPPDLFGEPAWDILLELYAAEQEGKSTTISAACLAPAAVPPTTALRYLNAMLDAGMIKPWAEGKTRYVRLAEATRDRMTALLDRMTEGRLDPCRDGEAPDRHGKP